MAILIDSRGLFRGKRVRKLSGMARLYYPYLLGMMNFYARIELDEEIIAHELSLLRVDGLDEDKVTEYFDEYFKFGLAMKYEAKGSTWAQFDTPLKMRAEFPSAEDNASPVPPEPIYTDWLKSLHGDDWADYHMTRYKDELSGKRADAGRKGAATTNAKRWGQQESANGQQKSATVVEGQQNRHVVVEGVVGEAVDVGVDVVDEVDVSTCTAIAIPDSKTLDSQTSIDSTAIKDQNPLAEVLAKEWFKLMEHNEYFDKKFLPRNGSPKFQEADFSSLLDIYEEQELREILAFSQSSDKQMQFNYRTKSVLDNHIVLFDKMKVLKKTPNVWNVWWKRYCSNSGYVPAQTGQVTFNIEADEDDGVATARKPTAEEERIAEGHPTECICDICAIWEAHHKALLSKHGSDKEERDWREPGYTSFSLEDDEDEMI